MAEIIGMCSARVHNARPTRLPLASTPLALPSTRRKVDFPPARALSYLIVSDFRGPLSRADKRCQDVIATSDGGVTLAPGPPWLFSGPGARRRRAGESLLTWASRLCLQVVGDASGKESFIIPSLFPPPRLLPLFQPSPSPCISPTPPFRYLSLFHFLFSSAVLNYTLSPPPSRFSISFSPNFFYSFSSLFSPYSAVIASETEHELVDEGSLMVKHVDQSDGGQYTCEAWNLAGSKTTVPVNLYVHIKPNFLRGPKDTVTLTDRKVEFECQVSGDPPPQVSWRRLRGPLPEDRTEILDDHTLRIGRVTPGDEDTYVCEAVNVVGTARANATLTVYTAPEFLVRPQDVKASVGSSAAFECLAVGRPSPLVVWSRQDDHNLLLPRQDTPSGEPDDQPNVWVNAEGTLIINQVTRELSGWYSCAAVSAAGSLVARALLDVPAPTLHPPPVISVRPRNLTVTPEAVALMVCQAEGAARVTWTKDGRLLPEDDARITLLGSGRCRSAIPNIRSILPSLSSNPPPPYTLPPLPPFRSLSPIPLPCVWRARNSTTLTLAWGPPEQEGASPITSYILEIWNGSGQWTPLEEHIPAESYTLTGLKPNTQYRAVVRAMNMHGVSASSPVSGPLVTAGGGRPGGEGAKETNNDPEIRAVLAHPLVTLMPPTPISSTAIKLQWKVQEFEDYMDGFYVRYRDLSSGTHRFEMEAVTRSGAAHQAASYTVSDLAKFTEYEFFIVPYHRNIHGHPSNSRIAPFITHRFLTNNPLLPPAVPSAPPSGVESLVLNATSVVLSWRPPPREHTNGRITKYSVWLFVNKTVPHSNLTLEGNLHTLTLYNLTFGKHFTATVAAQTKAGQGPTSGGHTWLQDPSASSGSGEPKRVPSPLMAVLRETWFIGAVGAAGFLALSVFVAVVCYRRKRNEKRAMGVLINRRQYGSDECIEEVAPSVLPICPPPLFLGFMASLKTPLVLPSCVVSDERIQRYIK
ncbi:hypothetical protein C7M84_020153 [Penaeus vannamei]|uniref:Uncharacterized protein n=1 Tax=Penaeus vannamei TaxID=6689 RepID=A0A423SCQ1_PENVA|nr:hypothetical protein C7M84_020153 [Penaeus vannamei]